MENLNPNSLIVNSESILFINYSIHFSALCLSSHPHVLTSQCAPCRGARAAVDYIFRSQVRCAPRHCATESRSGPCETGEVHFAGLQARREKCSHGAGNDLPLAGVTARCRGGCRALRRYALGTAHTSLHLPHDRAPGNLVITTFLASLADARRMQQMPQIAQENSNMATASIEPIQIQF